MEEFTPRDSLLDYLSHYGFIEKYRVEKRQNNDEEIKKFIYDKGVFKKEEDNYYAIWSIEYSYKIEQIIDEKLHELKRVEKIYNGDRYILALCENVIHSFNKIFYEEINDLIDNLFYADAFSSKPEHFLGTMKGRNAKVLFIKTDIAYFGIAGVASDFAEEERIILSSKLEQSQDFFEILAPKYYDWNKLIENKAENFERIVEILLQKEKNISKVVAIGKTNASDRGRDFEVTELVQTFSNPSSKKWLVQCKYSAKSISPNNISGWVERVIEHNYDGFWLVTNNDITPTLFDQFKDVEKNPKYDFEVKFWQRFDLHIKMNLYNELFKELSLFEK